MCIKKEELAVLSTSQKEDHNRFLSGNLEPRTIEEIIMDNNASKMKSNTSSPAEQRSSLDLYFEDFEDFDDLFRWFYIFYIF